MFGYYSNITAQAEVLFVIPKLISSQMKSGYFRTLEELQQNFEHTVVSSRFSGRGVELCSFRKVLKVSYYTTLSFALIVFVRVRR